MTTPTQVSIILYIKRVGDNCLDQRDAEITITKWWGLTMHLMNELAKQGLYKAAIFHSD